MLDGWMPNVAVNLATLQHMNDDQSFTLQADAGRAPSPLITSFIVSLFVFLSDS